MKKSILFQYILIIIYFAITLVSYYYFPAIVTTHWGADGQPNGTMSREENALFMIGILGFVYGILKFSAKADPNKINIEKFKDLYEWFIVFFIGFFIGVNLLVTLWNFGYHFNTFYYLIPFLAAMYIVVGLLLGKVERNYSIGIRTPWTISNDIVWAKTHKLGSKLFILSGLMSLVGLIWIDYAIYFLMVPVILFSIFLTIYSYLIYKKINE
jgi:uncharacterized membrane protein